MGQEGHSTYISPNSCQAQVVFIVVKAAGSVDYYCTCSLLNNEHTGAHPHDVPKLSSHVRALTNMASDEKLRSEKCHGHTQPRHEDQSSYEYAAVELS